MKTTTPIQREYIPLENDRVRARLRSGRIVTGTVIAHNFRTKVVGIRQDVTEEFHVCLFSQLTLVVPTPPKEGIRTLLVRWLQKHHLWSKNTNATRAGVA